MLGIYDNQRQWTLLMIFVHVNYYKPQPWSKIISLQCLMQLVTHLHFPLKITVVFCSRSLQYLAFDKEENNSSLKYLNAAHWSLLSFPLNANRLQERMRSSGGRWPLVLYHRCRDLCHSNLVCMSLWHYCMLSVLFQRYRSTPWYCRFWWTI